MTLSIQISEELEARLHQIATRAGIGPLDYARLVLERELRAPDDAPGPEKATLDLFAKWAAEDRTDDPEEIARRNQEFEELKQALNRNREESGGPNARKVFPRAGSSFSTLHR